MITRQFSLEQMLTYPFEKEHALDKIAFFDIETTGFAADSTYLYLIGCAYFQEDSFQLIQWFCEDIREETVAITSFFDFIKGYELIIHYNGTGFDLPYLQRKCELLGITNRLKEIGSLDIYKKISPYKKLFKLNNFKQKSLETFLNIHRKDTANGGDLISVYQSYLGKQHYEKLRRTRNPDEIFDAPSEAELLLQQLLLHNEDDIRGLLYICPILNYADIFEKQIRILKAEVEEGIFTIHFELSAKLPVPVSFGNDLARFVGNDTKASLSIHVYEGELKFFYENYKEYYYLPAEDSVIHQSLAHFVDKEHRTKAKLSNCYIRKQGIFAPQYEQIFTPCFKQNYKDKLSFLEIHTDFLLQEEKLEQYMHHILSCIMIK